METQENSEKNWNQQQEHQREAILQTNIQSNNRVYEDIADEQEL